MNLTRRERGLLLALTTRGGRRRSGCCRCEGVRIVRELIERYPEQICFIAATETGVNELSRNFDTEKIRIVKERDFSEYSDTVNAQGVIAVAKIPPFASGKVEGNFVLALDQLGDPGNFGTIARTLCSAGGKELWLTNGSIDPWGDKAIRAGMGAQFSLNIRKFASLSELLKFAEQSGYMHCFITDPHQGECCFDCRNLFDHSVIVIGGEPNGVTGECGEASHITIPMPGGFESLNAAQAATVILFESVRRNWGKYHGHAEF